MGVWRGGETITNIFIDKYLGGGWSAVALILIIGLEVWRVSTQLLFCSYRN